MNVKRIIRRSIPSGPILFEENKILDGILRSRGIVDKQEMDDALKYLLPFSSLLNIESAANLLADSLAQEKKMLVIGDFDADGATSTALAIRILKALGAKKLDYLVPNRFDFGYGLTPELVQVAKTYKPDLIITVDNGISSIAGVHAAKEAGIRVLITDHHIAPSVLPKADVIINPNQPGDFFPSKALAGCGVLFYVMLALRAELRKRDWFNQKNIPEPNLANYLDIVALATVADVVPLDRNNRILVSQGLKRIRSGQCIPGILALLSLAKRIPNNVTSQDLGFCIGPRLNAAGRMDDMSIGIECLLADHADKALYFAESLDAFNKERKLVEQDMQQKAMQILKTMSLSKNQPLPLGLCLFDEHWHQGVIGILASRIKDKAHRPVIAFAKENNEIIKGSVRSISGIHIRDILVEVDCLFPDLIIKFGGHAMAAGLSLLQKNLTRFTEAFNFVLEKHLTAEMLEKIIETDGELEQEHLSLRFAEILQDIAPWGQQFPAPLFDGRFLVLDEQILAGKYLKFLLSLENGEKEFEAIAFNIDLETWPFQQSEYIHIVYRLDINEFKERRKLQLMIEQIEPITMSRM